MYRSDSILTKARPAIQAQERPLPRLCTTFLAMAAVLITGGGAAMAIEEPDYVVLKTEGELELRQYASYIVAETYVDADFDGAGNEGFRRLAAYIFGNNRSRQKLEMTAPVAQAPSEKIAMTAPVNMHRSGSRYRVTFMMPSEYRLETLPEPVDPEVGLREVPAHTLAALSYSGRWTQQRYEDHKDELETWIREQGWEPVGEAILARYDSPFKPWFLRRNEVLIPVRHETSP